MLRVLLSLSLTWKDPDITDDNYACQAGVIICALREAPLEYILKSEGIVANLWSFSGKEIKYPEPTC